MSGVADGLPEHHDTEVSMKKNNTGGKLGNCKNAGGVGGYKLFLLSLFFRRKFRWYRGIKITYNIENKYGNHD
jgi:hypothetical protein